MISHELHLPLWHWCMQIIREEKHRWEKLSKVKVNSGGKNICPLLAIFQYSISQIIWEHKPFEINKHLPILRQKRVIHHFPKKHTISKKFYSCNILQWPNYTSNTDAFSNIMIILDLPNNKWTQIDLIEEKTEMILLK